jgi:threo-3-hydroxy-L-aspartate ammonia-lyase
MEDQGLVTLDAVRAAAKRLRGVALRTPLVPAKTLSRRLGGDVRLKCECFQHTRSFKIRGAFNTLSGIDPEKRVRGVVAYSSGNHGQGVAMAARLLGTHAVIVVPVTVAKPKEKGIRRQGGEVVKEGHTSLERRAKAEEIARERGFSVVPGFDHPDTIAGQGTIGLEIAEDWPDVDTVLVPVGGGGLVSGIALAIRESLPAARVIGVEPVVAPSMHAALSAGEPVTIPRPQTIADGLAAVRVSDLTLRHVQAYVDEIVLVEEDEMIRAAAHLLIEENILVEYSGAATTAALLSGRVDCAGQRVAVVISGGNIDNAEIARLAQRADVTEDGPIT